VVITQAAWPHQVAMVPLLAGGVPGFAALPPAPPAAAAAGFSSAPRAAPPAATRKNTAIVLPRSDEFMDPPYEVVEALVLRAGM
jgi:hypothetical protein